MDSKYQRARDDPFQSNITSIWHQIWDYVKNLASNVKESSVARLTDGKSLLNIGKIKSLYAIRYFKYTIFIFCCYLFIGMLYFTQHIKYSGLNALYYIIVTFFTIGYGDYTPATDPERLFTIFYIMGGFMVLCIVGITMGNLIQFALEEKDDARSEKFLKIMASAKEKNQRGQDDDENTRSSASSKRSSSTRRLSELRVSDGGDFFPSPYSIKDEKILDLMRKVNMDVFDEELRDLTNSALRDIATAFACLFVGSFCISFVSILHILALV